MTLTDETRAVEILCSAGNYLSHTRKLSNIGINSDEVQGNTDLQALRIIAVALCTVKGANPKWLEVLVRNPAWKYGDAT